MRREIGTKTEGEKPVPRPCCLISMVLGLGKRHQGREEGTRGWKVWSQIPFQAARDIDEDDEACTLPRLPLLYRSID